MRKLLGLLVAGLLVVGVAGTAQAAKFVYTGTLTLELANLPPVVIPGGGIATVNQSNGGSHLNTLRLAGGRPLILVEVACVEVKAVDAVQRILFVRSADLS